MVKVLFDTNIIVAALSEAHEMYDRCKPWLDQVQIEQTLEGFQLGRILQHSDAATASLSD